MSLPLFALLRSVIFFRDIYGPFPWFVAVFSFFSVQAFLGKVLAVSLPFLSALFSLFRSLFALAFLTTLLSLAYVPQIEQFSFHGSAGSMPCLALFSFLFSFLGLLSSVKVVWH